MNRKFYTFIVLSLFCIFFIVACATVPDSKRGNKTELSLLDKNNQTESAQKNNKSNGPEIGLVDNQPVPNVDHKKTIKPTDSNEVQQDLSQMVFVPAGEFTMGKADPPPSEHCDDHAGHNHHEHHGHKDVDFGKPAHKVYLDSYYIDKYEVTNAEYYKFMQLGGYNNPIYWTNEGWEWRTKNNITAPNWWLNEKEDLYKSGPKYQDYPVTGISWYEAIAYANWVGKKLPTEAQWEKAARGTRENSIYPWGNDEPNCDYANYCAAKHKFCEGSVSTVGKFENGKSPYGAYDMSGNVWEWCRDPYSPTYYTESPYKNPKGAATSLKRILRGGAWLNMKDFICTTYRRSGKSGLRTYFTGFRCVVEIN